MDRQIETDKNKEKPKENKQKTKSSKNKKKESHRCHWYLCLDT